MKKTPRLTATNPTVRTLIGALIGLGVGAGMTGLRATHAVESLERKLVDSRTVAYETERPADPGIVLAVVDDIDIETLREDGYKWPWPLDLNALAFEWLSECQVRSVAVDIIHADKGSGPEEFDPGPGSAKARDEAATSIPEVEALGGAYHTLGRVALGYQLLREGVPPNPFAARVRRPVFDEMIAAFPRIETLPDFRRADVELPVVRLLKGAKLAGYFNVDTDDDGILRRAAPLCRLGDRVVPSLPLAAAMLAAPGAEFTAHEIRLEAASQRLGRDGTFLINYRGPQDSYPKVRPSEMVKAGSLLDAWRKGGRVGPVPSVGTARPEAVKGKIVLWGVDAVGVKDKVAMPASDRFPGPEAQATIIDNLLHGDGRVAVSRWANAGILLALALLLGWVGGRARRLSLFFLTSLAMLLALWVVAYQLFRHGWSIDLFSPSIALLVTYGGVAGFRFLTEGRRNKWLEGTFGQYLSPAVIEALKSDPSMLELGGRRRELSVFFSDVKGFTTISEALQPDDLVRLLNDYLTRQSAKVLDQDGVIDKFIGDAVMAFFGDPVPYADHALRACRAALRCRDALKDSEPVASELRLPGLENRIGINSGPAFVGNMGSDKRFNYTCMGDTVNLASRLEGANKAFGSHILMGPLTYLHVKDEVVSKPLARVRVVGKNEPVAIYELLALKGEAPEALERHAAAFARAHAALLADDLDGAQAALAEAEAARPGDGPVAWLLGLLADLRKGKIPRPWDGVYVLDAK